MLDAKYQSSISSSFREEDFLSFLSFVPMFKFFTTGQGQFLRQKYQMNKFGRGPLDMSNIKVLPKKNFKDFFL